MRIIRRLFWFSLLAIAMASMLPHILPGYWIADLFSHFKLQYLFLLLVILLPVSLLLFKKSLVPIPVLFLIIWNSWSIAPFYLEAQKGNGTAKEHLTILSMNLLASNTNYTEALELVVHKDPDILILLELSPQWEEQFEQLRKKYPYGSMHAQRDNFGIGMLSKFPMTVEILNFRNQFPPSILSLLKIEDTRISVLATHPVPPVNQDHFRLRNHQLKAIAELSKHHTGNFVVAGDLNTSSYSWHFKELLREAGLADSRKGFGIAYSWPAGFFPFATTLDHFLVKGKIKVLERTTERNIGSDHLPIFLKLGL